MGVRDNIYVNLKGGDRITLRNGDVLSYDEYYDKITNKEDSRVNYTDTLKHKSRRELDIIEVKRPVEYTTIFTEDDRKDEDEDTELDIEEVLEKVQDALNGIEVKKGGVITITL